MNEDELVSLPVDPPALDASEPAETGDDRQDFPEGTVPETPAPLGGAVAPDPSPDLPDPREPERLRKELTRLRDEIRSTRETLLRQEAEFFEFRSLYPGVPLSSLPDAVWDDVRRGIPLTAAFALSERRRVLAEKQAAEANRKNGDRDYGAVSGSASGFLSAREVRAMSPAEVRENYTEIMLSMPKWQ